jgi:hypothetical protein
VIVAGFIALLGFVEESRPAETPCAPAGAVASPAASPPPVGAGQPGAT